jgi:FAD/FMN-containing dehydrogenase
MSTLADRTPIEGSALDDLAAAMRGEVVRPTDATYDEHRKVWNGSIDKHPAVVARCAGAADVIAAIRFGREHELDIAVRGGGHSFPGLSTCDGGLVIDLSPMRGIRVDPTTRRATAQAGVLLGELDRETQPFGLAAPSGIVTHTGLAGLTLGGGIGWIMRRHGLTIDQLVSADVITADGEFVRASEDENADLFWGLRGGGGNFGVVTQFELDLVPLGPQVMAGPVFWLMKDAPAVLRFYRDWIADCPDEVMTIVVTRRAPALPIVPPDLVGQHVIAITACYAGPVEDGERVLAPLKSFGSPVLDLCMPKPYLVHQAMFDPSFKHGWHYYVRSCDVDVLNDEVIDVIVENASRIESPITSIALWQMGGAVARVGEDETAFQGRKAGHTFNINGNSETAAGFDGEREWVLRFWNDLKPWHTSVYVNFLMEEGEDRVRQAYGDAKYDRLKALKQQYDPHNVFHLNQNISPG